MPKIRILSDLHLESGPWTWQPVGEDILVLAGDIADASRTGRDRRRLLWDRIHEYGLPTVYILGNHEGYADWIPREELVDRIIQELPPNVSLLDRRSATILGIRFLGCSLWTDFSLEFGPKGGRKNKMSQLTEQLIEANIIDFHYLCLPKRVDGVAKRIRASDMAQWHREEKEWLDSEIHSSNVPTVVVTHFLPSPESIHERYAGQILNTYFATDCRSLMKDPVQLWIHGHTHSSCDYTVGSVRVVCNPRGYNDRGKGENPDFRSDFMVDISM